MLPDQPWLVKCQHCGALIWIDALEKVGEVDPFGKDDAKFRDVDSYDTPSIRDCFAVLKGGVSDTQKVRYLRRLVWWMGNDARRSGGDFLPLSDDEIANLRAFAALLDESDENDRIVKAEAMRELGKYEEAMALLSRPFSAELAQAADIIKSLTRKRDPFVREMKFE